MIIDFGSKHTVLAIGNTTKRVATAIAVDELTGEVVSYGDDAASIRERNQARIKVVQPVVRGLVTDLDSARHYLKLVWSNLGVWNQIRGGRVRILTSTRLTRLDKNVLAEALSEARGGRPEFIWNCLASAAGEGKDVTSPTAIAVVNLGAETSEIAIFSAMRLLKSELLPLGGNDLTRQIRRGASTTHGVDLAWTEAEKLKLEIGSALSGETEIAAHSVTARDRVSGLPTTIEISSADVHDWMEPNLVQLRAGLREAFSGLPPQVAADVYHGKILLTGGGALLGGMEDFITSSVGVECRLAQDPLLSGVTGARELSAIGRSH